MYWKAAFSLVLTLVLCFSVAAQSKKKEEKVLEPAPPIRLKLLFASKIGAGGDQYFDKVQISKSGKTIIGTGMRGKLAEEDTMRSLSNVKSLTMTRPIWSKSFAALPIAWCWTLMMEPF